LTNETVLDIFLIPRKVRIDVADAFRSSCEELRGGTFFKIGFLNFGSIDLIRRMKMSDLKKLDRVFHFIIRRMVETGQAPHFTEIAGDLNSPMEEGRKFLRELFAAGVPGWLFPDTDYITSFAPFNNLPTQYRITIDGQQKWFGQ
jgi:hypothetical protein